MYITITSLTALNFTLGVDGIAKFFPFHFISFLILLWHYLKTTLHSLLLSFSKLLLGNKKKLTLKQTEHQLPLAFLL
jgi:hypothetical protein